MKTMLISPILVKNVVSDSANNSDPDGMLSTPSSRTSLSLTKRMVHVPPLGMGTFQTPAYRARVVAGREMDLRR